MQNFFYSFFPNRLGCGDFVAPTAVSLRLEGYATRAYIFTRGYAYIAFTLVWSLPKSAIHHTDSTNHNPLPFQAPLQRAV